MKNTEKVTVAVLIIFFFSLGILVCVYGIQHGAEIAVNLSRPKGATGWMTSEIQQTLTSVVICIMGCLSILTSNVLLILLIARCFIHKKENLDWGIEVPKAGYETKKIYIWAENVLGYLSASAAVTKQRGLDFKEIWGQNAKHYYVHGKDNIPFHTIILPALLIAHGEQLHLPDEIISSEYLTLEGRRISTSQNWAIWVKDIVDRYNPDSLRYFFTANGPEKRDTDFTWREFVERNNSELLGAYGNFVNRTLAFINKYLDGRVPNGSINTILKDNITNIYSEVGFKIERGQFKDALDVIFEFVRYGNKYFDINEPWKTRETAPEACGYTLLNCVQIIANLAVLLNPFLPFSSEKIFRWLSINSEWRPQYIPEKYLLPDVSILFERLDKSIVDAENNRLKQRD